MNTRPQNLEQALIQIEYLENTIALMKKQIAQETAERYGAYQRIVQLRQQLTDGESVIPQ